jgi:hypothetical protein
VLPGNASVICEFWILCLVYWINRQAEFTINYNILSISHTRGLLATRYIFTGRLLPLWISRGCLLPRTNLELSIFENHTELKSRTDTGSICNSLYNRRTDHTENISASIVETCVLSHCRTTVAALTIANPLFLRFPATTSKHSFFYCCLPSEAPTVTAWGKHATIIIQTKACKLLHTLVLSTVYWYATYEFFALIFCTWLHGEETKTKKKI